MCSLLSSAIQAAEYPGAIPDAFSVSDQGAAQYSIPIATPAATGGLKPNLSLTYNHLAGNGLAGMRWTLSGFSAIARCQKTYAQDGEVDDVSYDSDDRFCLDGQRLIGISGTYGANGAEYRTEIETFQRIKSVGTAGSGPQYFTVEHGNGSKSYYGYASDSRIEKVGSSSVRVWYISYTEDQFGNRISYGYDENTSTGEVLPDEVTWTSNSGQGLTAKYKVEITYETRPSDDQRSGYEAGDAPWAKTKRISYIRVYHTPGSTYEISEYALSYASSTNTGRSQLIEVTLQGENTDTLPETVFAVQNGTKSWNGRASTGETAGGNTQVGDFNNDGKMDVFGTDGTGDWQVWRGREDGDFESPTDSNVSYAYSKVIDYQGDGYSDLLYVDGSNNWKILPSTGTSFGSAISTGLDATSNPPNGINGSPNVQDFDGDGLQDLVYIRGTNMYWRRSTGSGFASEDHILSIGGESSEVWGIGPFETHAPDFNGDGRADAIGGTYACDPFPPYCLTQWGAVVASGDDYVSYPGFGAYSGLGISIYGIKALDANGDGLDDILLAWSPDSNWFLYLSNGEGFDSYIGTGAPASSTSGGAFIADYDSDGRDDLIQPEGDYWKVYRSTGSNFPSTATESISSTGAEGGGFAADITGDGLPDILQAYSSTWYTFTHKGDLPDVVTTFTNGLGYGIDVTYESLSNAGTDHYYVDTGDSPPAPYVQRFSGARYVVTHEDRDDGIGGTRNLIHKYDTAFIDRSGRGWLSFDNHIVDDDTDGDTYTYTALHQDWPYAGRPALSQLRRASDNQVIEESDIDWTKYTWTTSTPDRHFIYLDKTTSKTWEVGGTYNNTQLRTVVDEPTYSTTYGMLEDRTVTVTQPGTSNSWTTVIDYNPTADTGTNEWCLGLPGLVTTTVTAQPGSSSATRKLNHTFSGTDCSLTQTIDESMASTADRLKTTITHDSFGNPNVVTLDSANGAAADRSVDYDYDSWGQYVVEETIGTVNLSTETGWDYLHGQPDSIIGTDGLETTFSYDSFGRLENETLPNGADVDYSYVACGTCFPGDAVYYVLADHSDGNDDYEYFDALNRSVGSQWRLVGGEWGRQQTEYNGLGQVLKVSQPYISDETIYWESYVYDLIGRTTQITGLKDAGTTTTSVSYLGHTTQVTDPRSEVTSTLRNAMGQIVQVTDAESGTASYTYKPFGELASLTDAESNATYLDYDARGFKTELDDPSYNDDWTYGYSVFGELTSQTSPIDQGGSATAALSYDQAGRLTQRVEDEGTTTWTYNAYTESAGPRGKLYSVSSPGGYAELYSYYVSGGGVGQVAWIRRTIDSNDYYFNLSYDAQGRLDVLTYPTTTAGYRFKADYDYSYGQLAAVKDGNNTSYAFYTLSETDALGQERVVTLGNGLKETRGFYARTGRLNTLLTEPTGGGTDVQNLTLTYDEVGNLKTRDDNTISIGETLNYDGLSRLTSSQVDYQSAISIAYSAAGRITSKTGCGSYSYGAGVAGPHAVTGTTSCGSFTYDDNGRMITRAGDDITWYTYDQVKKIEDGSNSSEFWYDADRSRIKQRVIEGASDTTIGYVGTLFEFEDDASNGSIDRYRHYVHTGSRVVAMVEREGTTNTTKYLHRDHQGSVTRVSNASGAEIEALAYDPWGLRRDATDWDGSPSGSPYETDRGYTGHEHLDAVGLVHMNGRVQDPAVGRFISADPFVQAPYFTQSQNRYSYVMNNPASLVDPSGFWWDCNVVGCVSNPNQSEWSPGRDGTMMNGMPGPVLDEYAVRTGDYEDPYDPCFAGCLGRVGFGQNPWSDVGDPDEFEFADIITDEIVPPRIRDGVRVSRAERRIDIAISLTVARDPTFFDDVAFRRYVDAIEDVWSTEVRDGDVVLAVTTDLTIVPTESLFRIPDADFLIGRGCANSSLGCASPAQREIWMGGKGTEGTATHEFGHILGLGNLPYGTGSIMSGDRGRAITVRDLRNVVRIHE